MRRGAGRDLIGRGGRAARTWEPGPRRFNDRAARRRAWGGLGATASFGAGVQGGAADGAVWLRRAGCHARARA